MSFAKVACSQSSIKNRTWLGFVICWFSAGGEPSPHTPNFLHLNGDVSRVLQEDEVGYDCGHPQPLDDVSCHPGHLGPLDDVGCELGHPRCPDDVRYRRMGSKWGYKGKNVGYWGYIYSISRYLIETEM